jgi:HAD superfamily hydrolase (TIGR01509 family)
MKALIFDLDGTLIDSVYCHALAWQKTLAGVGIACPAWEIHRRIGMSGKLLVKAIMRQRGQSMSESLIAELEEKHSRLFQSLAPTSAVLPGSRELLAFLHRSHVAHGIATSGKRADIEPALKSLGLSSEAVVVDGDMVAEVKPEPDLFLLCQQKLGVEPAQCIIVGDAVWDIHAARRSGILSVGLMSGGSAEQELYNAGAMRVYKDAAALLSSIDELGIDV